MNSFEFNKIAAAVLVALLIAFVTNMIGESLIHPKMLEKNVFIVEGVEDSAAGGGSAASAEEEKVEPIAPLLAKADVAAGEKLAIKLCGQCHSFKSGEAHKTGPNLFGIVGGAFAHAADYAYSAAFKEKQGKENWDAEKLNLYLHKPRGYIKGTKMAFAGIKKAEDRAAVIAYLSSLK